MKNHERFNYLKRTFFSKKLKLPSGEIGEHWAADGRGLGGEQGKHGPKLLSEKTKPEASLKTQGQRVLRVDGLRMWLNFQKILSFKVLEVD